MKCLRYILVLLLSGLSSGDVRADGGIIRLHEAQGPFVVTIFTTSEPVKDGPVDVSVMVQQRDSSEAILDASVDLMFTPPAAPVMDLDGQICGASGAGPGPHAEQFNVPATRQQASNKLLYAAPVKFGTTGNWQLQAFVERGNEAVKIACGIPVGSPPRRLSGLLPYLVLPPLLVALFAANQYLRKHLAIRGSFSQPA
jgi:hypothetical protein